MEGVQEEKRTALLLLEMEAGALSMQVRQTHFQLSSSPRQAGNAYNRIAKFSQAEPSSATDHILKLRFADRYGNNMQGRPMLALGAQTNQCLPGCPLAS